MAKFDLVFSGICAMVPKRNESGDIIQAAMLMVNGREIPDDTFKNRYSRLEAEPQLQPAGTRLSRHRAFMKIPAKSLDITNLSGDLIVDLHRMRVRFALTGGAGGLRFQAAVGDSAVFEMSRVFSAMNPSATPVSRVRSGCLAASGNVDPFVSSQIIVETGLVIERAFAAHQWWFELADHKENYVLRPAAEIAVDMGHATQLEIIVEAFDGSSSKTYALKADTRVELLNLCDVNPLRWPSSFAREWGERVDRDFMWFYELLDDVGKDWVKTHRKEIAGLLFPAYPVVMGSPGGGGDNCRPVKFPTQFW